MAVIVDREARGAGVVCAVASAEAAGVMYDVAVPAVARRGVLDIAIEILTAWIVRVVGIAEAMQSLGLRLLPHVLRPASRSRLISRLSAPPMLRGDSRRENFVVVRADAATLSLRRLHYWGSVVLADLRKLVLFL
jgi:hypothetical protein